MISSHCHDSLSVLIVDDSELIREKLAGQLRTIPEFSEADQAGTVMEALRRVNDRVPQVVVLDIKLADGTGFEVLKEIRRQGMETAVVMYTNLPASGYRRFCLEAGADLFLEKAQGFTLLMDVLRWLAREKHKSTQRTSS
ncbi:MAG: hypothetical protein HBSIN02_06490 [Bacteroidia bacterium]|nr:MAG: hypothetical protein HBSIN02_06490 [Bacteroidia bacterium]